MMQDDDQGVESEANSPVDSDDASVEMSVDPLAFEDSGEALDDAALGQSEIDDLFGIGMDDEEPTEGIHALLNSQYIRHKRMPALEACFERMAHTLARSLRTLAVEDIEINLTDSSTVRFGNYIEEIPLPALISVFKVVEWQDYGLINIDTALIYSLIDVMLGGRRSSPSFAIETRSFTAIEAKLIERMILLTLEDMTKAFKPLSDVTFQFERMESNPSIIDIVSPSNIAILFAIEVNLSDRGGRIEVLIPYATLEPIAHLLEQMFTGDSSGKDSIWESHLKGQMLRSDVELEVTFGKQMMPLGKLLSLEVGSTLTLRNKPDEPVTLCCGDTTLMNAHIGRVGDLIAIQIADWCKGAKPIPSQNDCQGG